MVNQVISVNSPPANGRVIHNKSSNIDSVETAPTAGVDDTTTVTSSPTLNISKADGPDPVAAGSNITYAISYSNTGNANATGVVINDTTQASRAWVEGRSRWTPDHYNKNWNIGGLAAGASSQ